MFQIFTDVSANLPQETVERHGLGMVSLVCSVDGEPLDLSGGFDGKAFYDKMRAGALTKTSMPSMGTFFDEFTPTLEKGMDILYIAMSSGISGTVGLSQTAAEELLEQFPDRRIVVIDTRGASLGEGLHVFEAIRLRDEGKSLDEVAEVIRNACDYMCQVFTVEDLEYLKRGGRLHSATAKVGNLLHVKPILMGDDKGRIIIRNMSIGRRRSLDTLAAKYRDSCADKSRPVGLAHADCEADVKYVEEKLREAGCTGEIHTVLYEPVTGSHVGPGTVALFFYGEHR